MKSRLIEIVAGFERLQTACLLAGRRQGNSELACMCRRINGHHIHQIKKGHEISARTGIVNARPNAVEFYSYWPDPRRVQ
jgi:hypothetical protein